MKSKNEQTRDSLQRFDSLQISQNDYSSKGPYDLQFASAHTPQNLENKNDQKLDIKDNRCQSDTIQNNLSVSQDLRPQKQTYSIHLKGHRGDSVSSEEDKENAQIKLIDNEDDLPVGQKQASYMSHALLRKTKVHPLFLIVTVQKAVNKFLKFSSSYQFHRLKNDQFKLISDSASSYRFYQQKGMMINQLTIPQHILLYVKTLHYKLTKKMQFQSFTKGLMLSPDSKSKILVDIWLLFSYVSFVILVPLYLAFTGSIYSISFHYFWSAFPIIVFLIDMGLKFFTSFYDKGVLITKHSDIINKYFKSSFFFDFGLLLVYLIMVSFYGIETFIILILLKAGRISSIIKGIEENIEIKEQSQAVISLSKLIIQILMIAHICGCGFFYLQEIEIQNGYNRTWVTQLDLDTENWFSKYVNCLYWAVVTMVTIGYGDITPITTEEKVYVILIALIGSGVFAYSLNGIGAIFKKMEKKNKQSSEQINILTSYLRKRNLSHELVMKVQRYFEYLNEENSNENNNCKDMLEQLGSELKLQVQQDIYYKLLNSQKLLALNFSDGFLLDLSAYIKELRYGPEQYIYREGEVPDSLFIVMHGNIEVRTKITRLQVLKRGDICGKLSFITCREEQNSAITLDVVSVGIIQKSVFLEILKKYPLDNQKFLYLKDNFNINSVSRGLDLGCISCGDYTHQVNQCPYVTYIPNKQKFLYDRHLQYNEQQKLRVPFNRREQRSIRPTAYIDVSHEAAAQILIDLDVYKNLDELLQRINQIEEVRKEDQVFKSMDYESDDSIMTEKSHKLVVPMVSTMNQDIFGDSMASLNEQMYIQEEISLKKGDVQQVKQETNKKWTEISFEESQDLKDQDNISLNTYKTNKSTQTQKSKNREKNGSVSSLKQNKQKVASQGFNNNNNNIPNDGSQQRIPQSNREIEIPSQVIYSSNGQNSIFQNKNNIQRDSTSRSPATGPMSSIGVIQSNSQNMINSKGNNHGTNNYINNNNVKQSDRKNGNVMYSVEFKDDKITSLQTLVQQEERKANIINMTSSNNAAIFVNNNNNRAEDEQQNQDRPISSKQIIMQYNFIFAIKQSFDIDKFEIFKIYMPNNNINKVLEKLRKIWHKHNGDQMIEQKQSRKDLNKQEDLREQILYKMETIQQNRKKSIVSNMTFNVNNSNQMLPGEINLITPKQTNEAFSVYSKGGVRSHQSKSRENQNFPLDNLSMHSPQPGGSNIEIEELSNQDQDQRNVHIPIFNANNSQHENQQNVYSSEDEYSQESPHIESQYNSNHSEKN